MEGNGEIIAEGGVSHPVEKESFRSTSKMELLILREHLHMFCLTEHPLNVYLRQLEASSFNRRNCCGENFPLDIERSFS